MRKILKEGKADIELAVTKCLTGAKLSPAELNEICDLGESDLMRDYGCDLYMAETVKLHAKKEMLRLRAQNQYTKMDGLWNDNGYPTKPFSRTDYIKESRRRLREDHQDEDGGGRMMDYGHNKSDAEEGRMLKQYLRDIAVDAYRLHQMLEDGDDLPQWCQYKMAQAQGMVGSVRNYLEYQLERSGDDLVGEKEMFDPEEMEEDFGEESAKMAMDSWGDDDDYDDDDDDDDDDDYDVEEPPEYDTETVVIDDDSEETEVESTDETPAATPESTVDDDGYDGADVNFL